MAADDCVGEEVPDAGIGGRLEMAEVQGESQFCNHTP